PLLAVALKDHEDKIRLEALTSLQLVSGDIHPALPEVAAQLQSGNSELRSAAGDVLQKMDARALPHLIAALEHPSEDVRSIAVRAQVKTALKSIQGKYIVLLLSPA